MRPGHEKADKGGFRLRRQDRGGDEGDREQPAQNGDVIHRSLEPMLTGFSAHAAICREGRR